MGDRSTSEEGPRNSTPSDYPVIEATILRRRSGSVASTRPPPPDKPESVRRPAKVARQLALAHHLQVAIERGLVADQAALARKPGLTGAGVTQLFDLLTLAADLQAQVLSLEPVDGTDPMAERTLRPVAHAGTWTQPRAAWGTSLGKTLQNQVEPENFGCYRATLFAKYGPTEDNARMEDRWLSVDEIAEYLGVSKDTVYTWINAKGMPAHRVGRLWKFKRDEVDEWVRSGGATQGNNSEGRSS